MAGKGEGAMLRLIKEFTVVSAVPSGTSSAITFTGKRPGTSETHTVSVVGTELRLDADVLTDQINAFTLQY